MPDRDVLDILKGRLDEAIGGNVADFARRGGMDKSEERSLLNWAANPGSVKAANLARIAAIAGKPVAWFFGETAHSAPGGAVMVPVLDAQAAAGFGRIPDQVRAIESFPFPRAFIERLGGSAHHVQAFRSFGDSMQPTIADGALIMVDTSVKTLPKPPDEGRKAGSRRARPADIYVFMDLDDGLLIKRFQRIDAHVLAIISDNISLYPPKIVMKDAFGRMTIIGKVIWWDNRL